MALGQHVVSFEEQSVGEIINKACGIAVRFGPLLVVFAFRAGDQLEIVDVGNLQIQAGQLVARRVRCEQSIGVVSRYGSR